MGSIIKNFICGMAVGGGAILPGISGGVLCVVFGIYRPMMELLSHPVRGIKKYWMIFLPFGVGFLAGFWGFAKVVDILFVHSQLYATWLFIGLIIGTLPALYKEAGKQGRTKKSYLAMAIGFVVLFSVLMYVRFGPFVEVKPNIGWFAFCGVLWGLSIVIPGMTSSSILMSLGIYQSMNAGIAIFDMSVIIPWLFGMLLTAILLARLVNAQFEKHYSISYHTVVGIVIASTIVIIPFEYERAQELLIGLLCGILGFGIAFLSNYKKKEA